MKFFIILSLASMMMTITACHRDDDQSIQREEEMDREDMGKDDYKQSDISGRKSR